MALHLRDVVQGWQNMQPLTQDLGAISLLARRGVLDDVKRGDWAGAMRGGAAAVWASLPKGLGDSAGAYGQINDSGRYGKVLASIDRYRRGVNELYSQPARALHLRDVVQNRIAIHFWGASETK
jgi:hypothetical protein